MDFLGIGPAELRNGLILYIILVASLCVHEWAHAITADKLGDDTPRHEGRVTLNPFVHMDLLGTVIFPLFCIFFLKGSFFFGWAKPVMINLGSFRNRQRDHILVTLAGPVSNVGLALLAAIVGGLAFGLDPQIVELFVKVIIVNITLAVFNMLPLPPLDGSHIMRYLVGMSEELYFRIAQWSFLILIVLINIPQFKMGMGILISNVAKPFFALLERIAS